MNKPTRYFVICTISALSIGCGNSTSSINNIEGNTNVDSPVGSNAQSIGTIPASLPISNQFENNEITEASGVQRSLSLPGVYYVHNDSGASAMLFVADALGQSLGQIKLSGVEAVDWEAIAGVRLNGQPHIVVADIGNNGRDRNDLHLQVVSEPNFDDLALDFELTLDSRRVDISYADGLDYDAEAIFIDGDNDTVVIVTKNGRSTAEQSIWKGSLASGLSDGSMVLEYRGLIALPAGLLVNAVTDIDIHPDGRQLAVLVYGSSSRGKVFLWQPATGEGTADALARPADQEVSVPVIGSNGQAEGISFSVDGEVLLIAAEGSGTSTMTLINY